jgi:hypothetical protein
MQRFHDNFGSQAGINFAVESTRISGEGSRTDRTGATPRTPENMDHVYNFRILGRNPTEILHQLVVAPAMRILHFYKNIPLR